MKKIIVLGCTGSIGQSTLQIVRDYPEDFIISGLSAHQNSEMLLKAAREFSVTTLCLSSQSRNTDDRIQYTGSEGLEQLIRHTEADIVVNGITGLAGLIPSATTLESGRDLALANKETLVAAGEMIISLADKNNCRILPVDSEHSALFMLLHDKKKEEIDEIILTASGGAFRDRNHEELKHVTLSEALTHPNWDMGPKITIDSATMANKGLEVTEAQRLFPIPLKKIKVLIHPQSYVHSLIRTTDGAMYAQISYPDMRLPIQNALTYPVLQPVAASYLDLAGKNLEFSEPDLKKYPLLKLAYQAAEKNGAYPATYNAANEIAVAAFINKALSYLDIHVIVEKILQQNWTLDDESLKGILDLDRRVREQTRKVIKNHHR